MLTEHIMATRPYAQAALLTVIGKGKEMYCPTACPQLTCNKVPRGIWEHIAKTWMAQAFHRKVRAEDSHFHQPQGAGHPHQPGICSAAEGWGGSLCTPHGMAVNKQNECSDQLFNSQQTKWVLKSALQQSENKVSTQISSSTVSKQSEYINQLFSSQKTKWVHNSALQQSAKKVSTQFSSSTVSKQSEYTIQLFKHNPILLCQQHVKEHIRWKF